MGGVKDEKSEYYEGSLKNPIFRGKGGGAHGKPIYGGGEVPKKGGAWMLGQFADSRGA